MNNLQMWSNGEFLDTDKAQVSLLDHGLHYGTGVFEGIRCYQTDKGPAVFRLSEHLSRMAEGARTIDMNFDVHQMHAAILELLARNKMENAYIRPLAYYGGGYLGLDVAPLQVNVAVATLPWKSHLGVAASMKGTTMSVSKVRRNPASAMPPLKLCGGYVNSVLAKLSATRKGFDEALFVDDDGRVCEATGENVFFVKNGDVFAIEHPDALAGITRHSVMELANAKAVPVYLKELLQADEVFVTGTSAEVVGVSAIDDLEFGVGPVTRELAAAYQDVVHGRDSTKEKWLTWVK
jgi:branched-chain amino acid aminotransferase